MIPVEVAIIAQIIADDAANGCTYEDFIQVAYEIYKCPELILYVK